MASRVRCKVEGRPDTLRLEVPKTATLSQARELAQAALGERVAWLSLNKQVGGQRGSSGGQAVLQA